MTAVWILSKQNDDQYENGKLLESFSARDIPVQIMNPDKFDLIVNKNSDQSIFYDGVPVELPKILLVRHGAGTSDFILAVIRQLEHSGVRCINTAESIDMVQDKLMTAQVLADNSLPTPKTMMVRYPVDISLVEDHIGFPCIIKLKTGSYGNGVYLCERKRDFSKLMEFIDNLDTSKTLLIQEYLGDRVGEDLRVIVVGGRVIGAMKRIAQEGEFRANISGGGRGEPYPLNDEIEFLARESARVFNLDIAGVDLLFDKDGFRVLEVNSNPGFKGATGHCNIPVADAITEYISFKL